MNVMQDFITGLDEKRFPMAVRGDGIYIWDKEGRRYLDGSSGAVASNIGHGNARVKEAMRRQSDLISFAYARVWENEANVALAERLARLSGLGLDSVFPVSGGTEAVEAAIKLAKQAAYAQGERARWKVVSRNPSYHGSTIGMLGITGDPDFAEPFRQMFVAMPKVPVPWTYRIPANTTPEEHAIDCANALEECILREGPETVLAFVMEPVGGTATGALVAPDIYYTRVREVCDRYGVYLIFDEVMSGAGRTGRFLAAHHWDDCRPDIVALAKGVSGGYAPLGAVLTSSKLVDALRRMGGFRHGHTYAANPQACAIACAVLDEIVDRDLIANAASAGELLGDRLRELSAECGVIGDVRGRGLLLAIEIVADKVTRQMFPAEWDAIGRIRERCRENGLVLLSRRTSGGRFGEWLMLCPPLIIEEPQIEELIAALRSALLAYQDEIARRQVP